MNDMLSSPAIQLTQLVTSTALERQSTMQWVNLSFRCARDVNIFLLIAIERRILFRGNSFSRINSGRQRLSVKSYYFACEGNMKFCRFPFTVCCTMFFTRTWRGWMRVRRYLYWGRFLSIFRLWVFPKFSQPNYRNIYLATISCHVAMAFQTINKNCANSTTLSEFPRHRRKSFDNYFARNFFSRHNYDRFSLISHLKINWFGPHSRCSGINAWELRTFHTFKALWST